MSHTWWLDTWLCRTAIAGGSILLLGLIWMLFTRQPAQRQRIGELSLGSGLLVALLAALPGWWSCRLDWMDTSTPLVIRGPASAQVAPKLEAKMPLARNLVLDTGFPEETGVVEILPEDWSEIEETAQYTGFFWLMMNPADRSDTTLASPTPRAVENIDRAEPATEAAPLVSVFEPFPWLLLLAWAYFLIMGYLLGRCLLGYLGLWRLARTAEPAPDHALSLLDKLTAGWKHKPQLGVVDRLHGPISFGLWRPTILLPPKFCHAGDQSALRALLVHEITHLERRDAWSCLLLALAQAVYFYLPWFWWLRRQIHLAQEYIADAAAACWSSAVDYAQYLVSWSTWTARPTLAGSRASGVFQRTSELYRRVDMLLKNPVKVEAACSRRWTFAAAASFLAVAALAAGVRVQADEKQPPKKSVTIVIDGDDDDAKVERKIELRKHAQGHAKVADHAHQRLQIVIIGDGETKLAEVPMGVKRIMLQPTREEGKPQRIELMLVDDKEESGQGHKKPIVLSGKRAVVGDVKAHAIWQGKLAQSAKEDGPNVIRIIALDDAVKAGKIGQPHQIEVIGVDGKHGKHEIRVQAKPVISTTSPFQVEKVDVIIVDEKGDVLKKEIREDILKSVKAGTEGKKMFFRIVEDKEGGKPGTIRLRTTDLEGKMVPGLPALPSVPAMPGTPALPGRMELPSRMALRSPMTPMSPMSPMAPMRAMPEGFTFSFQDEAGMKERLEKISKAVDELEKALNKAGDRIPAEARKQLLEAKKQLEEARAKLSQSRGRFYQVEPRRPAMDRSRPMEEKEKAKDAEKDDARKEDGRRRERDEQTRRVEQYKRMAEAARQQADAQRQQAEAMARLAKEREEQARKLAQMHEEQARRAEAEARKAMEDAERAGVDARRQAERAHAEARRHAEEQARKARTDDDRADTRKRGEEMSKRGPDSERLRDEIRRKVEEAQRKANEESRAGEKQGGDQASKALREEMEARRKAREAHDMAMQEQLQRREQFRQEQREKAVEERARQQERGAAAGATRGGRLGVQIEILNPDVAAQLDLPGDLHVVVRQVMPGSAAEKAGMKNHDILLTFAGKEIKQPGDLMKVIEEGKFERGVEAVVLRKGKKVVLRNIELGAPARRSSSGDAAPAGGGSGRGAARSSGGDGGTARSSGGDGRKDPSSTGNSFTIVSNDDDLRITIKGKVVEGQMSAESITIKDGDQEDTYDSLRRVPSRHRAKVQKLLEQSGKATR